MRAYFEQVYDERAANPGTDLISGFIQAEINGEHLTRSEVLNMAILLLIGVVETTTNLMGITFAHLKKHPATAAAIWTWPGKITTMLDEMRRFDGRVKMQCRNTTRDTE